MSRMYYKRKIGFSNISVDLIFGLPTQSIEIWNNTLEDIIKLKPDHISAYSLKVEEGTSFYAMQGNGELEIPSEQSLLSFSHIIMELHVLLQELRCLLMDTKSLKLRICRL